MVITPKPGWNNELDSTLSLLEFITLLDAALLMEQDLICFHSQLLQGTHTHTHTPSGTLHQVTPVVTCPAALELLICIQLTHMYGLISWGLIGPLPTSYCLMWSHSRLEIRANQRKAVVTATFTEVFCNTVECVTVSNQKTRTDEGHLRILSFSLKRGKASTFETDKWALKKTALSLKKEEFQHGFKTFFPCRHHDLSRPKICPFNSKCQI